MEIRRKMACLCFSSKAGGVGGRRSRLFLKSLYGHVFTFHGRAAGMRFCRSPLFLQLVDTRQIHTGEMNNEQ